MRKAWKLGIDYLRAIRGTIAVRLRRSHPVVRVALVVGVAALCLLGFQLFGSEGTEQAGSEPARPDDGGVGRSVSDDDENPVVTSLDARDASDETGELAADARSTIGSATRSAPVGASDSPDRGAARTSTDSGTGVRSPTAATPSQGGGSSSASSGGSEPSPGTTSPTTTSPAPESATEPDETCTPSGGLVRGLVGGLVCLVDGVL